MTLDDIIEDECNGKPSENGETHHEITEAYEFRENDQPNLILNRNKFTRWHPSKHEKVYSCSKNVRFRSKSGYPK